MKTKEMTEGKKIFHPDLRQGIGLQLLAIFIGMIIFLLIKAIAIGEENLEVREQWLDKYYLLFVETGMLLAFGGTIAYAIWKKRSSQSHTTIFSFRSVPISVFVVILFLALFSQFSLDPLILLFPSFQEARADYFMQLENYGPIVSIGVTIANIILIEWLFRGIILKGLLKTTTPKEAFFWNSLSVLIIFSYFYIFINFILGWIYWKTRSLYPTIFMMVIWVFIPYVMMPFSDHPKAFFFHFSWWELVEHNLMIYLPLVIASFLLSLGLCYYLHKRLSVATSSTER